MKTTHLKRIRFASTTVGILLACLALYYIWLHFRVQPWTRDGKVRADIVQIAPDVSGLITQVRVKDNQQVKAGDLIFSIDPERYGLALKQAKSAQDSLNVQIAQAQRELKRNLALGDLVAAEQVEQSRSKLEQLQASIAQSQTVIDAATLNLKRSDVRAGTNGLITNFELRPGSYAVAGHPLLAVIDTDSTYVVGYFEETKIDRIHIGDVANIHLMGSSTVLKGHVQSIAGGIEDREMTSSASLLANVNPTFNWVRLAQRIPVRVQFDKPPSNVRLIIGRTVSVEVIPHKDEPLGQSQK